MIKKSFILIVALGATFVNGDEVSAFDAGNLNSSSPYGLTQNEEKIYKSTQKVDNLENNFETLNQKIEGLSLVIESQNNKILSLQNELNRIDLNKTVELGLKDKEIQNLKAQINKLNQNSAAKASQTQATQAKKEIKEEDFKRKAYVDIEKEAQEFYSKKQYSQAKERFAYLALKNYKAANSYFYLGESEYFLQNYSQAVINYEKSVQLSDKADYMPILLYHTAISFDKLGQTSNANKFYKALKTSYPNSEQAKVAPNR